MGDYTMITTAEFSLLIALIVSSMSDFANGLDSVIIFTGTNFTFLDLLVSMAFIEITWDFILALAYGDYKREY